jgi:hypothetical protein
MLNNIAVADAILEIMIELTNLPLFIKFSLTLCQHAKSVFSNYKKITANSNNHASFFCVVSCTSAIQSEIFHTIITTILSSLIGFPFVILILEKILLPYIKTHVDKLYKCI